MCLAGLGMEGDFPLFFNPFIAPNPVFPYGSPIKKGIESIKFPQRETAESKKKNPGNRWLNSDKEVI